MKESSISTIIPAIDAKGHIKMPLSWGRYVCCITLTKDEAKELGLRLIKLGEHDGNN